MRPRLRSYGETSTRTLSPGRTRMRNRRILPARWARSSWSFSSLTRNSRFGRASVTSPSISSFCSTAIDTSLGGRNAGARQWRPATGPLHSRPHTQGIGSVSPGMHAARITSPIGPLYVEARDGRLTRLETNGRAAPPDTKGHFAALQAQLEDYFAGRRTTFDLPLDQQGTPFERRVWERLMAIPF